VEEKGRLKNLSSGWRKVLADYKQAALQRDPAASGIFISAEINDALVDVMPERMVACARCGVHLPESEALEGDGGRFCSEEHRRLGAA